MNAIDDGQYRSRKFIIALVALAILTGVTIGSIWFKGLETSLSSLTGGVLGVLSLYLTGNVATKYVVGKQVQVATAQAEVTAEREDRQENLNVE